MIYVQTMVNIHAGTEVACTDRCKNIVPLKNMGVYNTFARSKLSYATMPVTFEPEKTTIPINDVMLRYHPKHCSIFFLFFYRLINGA